MTPYRVAIVGSRNYPRMELIRQCIDRLASYFAARGRGLVVVSGTEPTPERLDYCVDSAAIHYARFIGLETVVFEADWNGMGKGAGRARNTLIVNQSDGVVAFWRIGSKGTADSIEKAFRRGNLRKVYGPDGNEVDDAWIGEALRRCYNTGVL